MGTTPPAEVQKASFDASAKLRARFPPLGCQILRHRRNGNRHPRLGAMPRTRSFFSARTAHAPTNCTAPAQNCDSRYSSLRQDDLYSAITAEIVKEGTTPKSNTQLRHERQTAHVSHTCRQMGRAISHTANNVIPYVLINIKSDCLAHSTGCRYTSGMPILGPIVPRRQPRLRPITLDFSNFQRFCAHDLRNVCGHGG